MLITVLTILCVPYGLYVAISGIKYKDNINVVIGSGLAIIACLKLFGVA